MLVGFINWKVTIFVDLPAIMNIFLIEDDAIYSEFIQKGLRQNAEYKVKPFASAEDALQVINGKLPDIIIVDYKLPGLSGIELYEKIKPRITDTNKVIMLSAIDDGNMVLSFIQKGVRDYVIKDENVITSLQAIISGEEENYF